MTQGIYQIKNIENDKIYIGSSTNIECRWADHKKGLNGNYHKNKHLQNSWDKYGKDAFEFTVIYTVDKLDELIAHEQWCLDVMFPEYNIAPFANSGFRGRTHTKKSKLKNRTSHLGKKASLETKAKIGASSIGRRHTEEAKVRIGRAKAGEGCNFSKLTNEDVLFARHLHGVCNVSYKKIGNYFAVRARTIRDAITGRTWKHLGEIL